MHRLLFYLASLSLGAFHALEPGHGKTVVAAYLVGSRGTKIDAVFLGIVVTITHTLSVIILAVLAKVASVKWALSDEALHGYIGLAAGALILGVGLWMLVSRLKGKNPLHFHSHEQGDFHDHNVLETERHNQEHSHSAANNPHSHDHGGGHSHDHELLEGEDHSHEQGHNEADNPDSHYDDDGHSHDHNALEAEAHHHEYSHAIADNPYSHDHDDGCSHDHGHSDSLERGGHDALSVDVEAQGKVGYWQLFLLGISGGLVPCPAAMALLVAGIGSGRMGEAVWLILLFSLGLAVALVAIGLAVVSASKFAGRLLDAKKFARKIAIASAGVITLIGIATIFGSVRHIISVVS